MFDPGQFVEDCRAALGRDATHLAVKDVMEQAFSDPDAVLRGVGEPADGAIIPLYRSDTLTILNIVWQPGVTLMPHNHNMWALIGIYTGREDNIFWRRIKDHPDGHIEAAGAKALSKGDVAPLGRDVIHSVTNPIPRLTGAIHVYGGDFFAGHRSQWDPEDLNEQPFDFSRLDRLFDTPA